MQRNTRHSTKEGVAMNTKQIFPIILIVLDLGACIMCAVNKDYKMALYWLSAGILNCCVTF